MKKKITKNNKYQIMLLLDVLIDNYNKDKEKFVNNILKSKGNSYFQVMPAENPRMKMEFPCIKMQLQFTKENVKLYELDKKEEEN